TVVAQPCLHRQIADGRNLLLRVIRKLPAHSTVAKYEWIIGIELKRCPAYLTLRGILLVSNMERKKFARGDAAGFDTGFKGVTASLMRQTGDKSRTRVLAILHGKDW